MDRIVTVFTKPDCVQCDQTKRLLKSWNVEFHEVAVDPKTAAELERLYGYRSAPVVLVSSAPGRITDHWSGFRHEKLKALHVNVP